MRMKKKIGKICIVAGMLVTASALLPQFSMDSRAEGLYQFISDKNSAVNILGKSELSREQFIKELIEESGGKIGEVYLHKLGNENLYKNTPVKFEDLDKELPQDISFITVDGKKLVGNRVVFADWDDEVANTIDEYNDLYEQYGLEVGSYRKVHTCLDIQMPNYLQEALAANGLFFGKVASANINDIKINTQTIGLSCDYANFTLRDTVSVECNFNDYKKNDEKLIEIIKAANISEDDKDEEKIAKFSVSILNSVPYGKYADYGKNSNIFSVATRKTAMCVGFSLGTARALNLMGIPAYMVTGMAGGPHATVRAYYDNSWHTVDTTSNGSRYTKDMFLAERVDRYNLYYKEEKVYASPEGRGRYMLINKEYEDWAELQQTEDLVLINKEAILYRRNTLLVSEDVRQNLIQRYELLSKSYEELKSYLTEYSSKLEMNNDTVVAVLKNIESAEKDAYNNINKIKTDDRLFIEEYRKYEDELKNGYEILEYLVNTSKSAIPNSEFNPEPNKDAELNKKADELLEKQKQESSKKEQENKPEIKDDKSDSKKEEQPEIKEDTSDSKKEEKPEIGEDDKSDTGKEEKPEIKDDYESDSGKGEKPEIKDDISGSEKEEKPEIKDDDKSDTEKEEKPEVKDDTSDSGKEEKPEIGEGDKSGSGKKEEPEIKDDTSGSEKGEKPEIKDDKSDTGKEEKPEIKDDKSDSGKKDEPNIKDDTSGSEKEEKPKIKDDKADENDRRKFIEKMEDIINKAGSVNKEQRTDNSNKGLSGGRSSGESLGGSSSRGGSGGSSSRGGSSRGGSGGGFVRRMNTEKNTQQAVTSIKNIVTKGKVISTGAWVKDNNVWKFNSKEVNESGAWVRDNNKWYLVDKNSVMQTGLALVDGVTYYLADDGSMQVAWRKLGNDWYYFNQNGSMLKGWLEYGGKWYYLGQDGKMLTNTVVDGYRLDKDGVWMK